MPNHDRPSSEWTPPTREVKRSPRSPPLGDLVGGSGDEHAPLVDDGHVRAQLLDGRHHVRGQDNGAATLRIVGEDLTNVGRGHGVDGLEGLVEDQDRGEWMRAAASAIFFVMPAE